MEGVNKERKLIINPIEHKCLRKDGKPDLSTYVRLVIIRFLSLFALITKHCNTLKMQSRLLNNFLNKFQKQELYLSRKRIEIHIPSIGIRLMTIYNPIRKL